MTETLKIEQPRDGLLLITLNRPERMNAFSTRMGEDVLTLFTRLATNRDAARCVVLTGAGDRAFCAGGDLKEREGMTDETWRAQHELFERAYYAVMDCPCPVIAAVNGVAFGGGTELALAADFAYAAENARFALPEVKLGIIPGCGGTQNLPRAIGAKRAKELIFTGRAIDAREALDWGLINGVFPAGELLPRVLDLAAAICANAPLSLVQAKKAINLGAGVDLKTALAIEVEAYNRLVVTEDRMEGVRAFNEKRAPRFTGR